LRRRRDRDSGRDQSLRRPCDACATTEIPAIIDLVRLPSTLPPGKYVVGWRWDAEQTAQVWSGCGDVEVVAAP